MPKPSRIILGLLIAANGALPAHAHLGHVGDLAGHSHWLGYGALAAAAAALALLGKKRKQEESDEGTESAIEAEGEQPEENAA